MTRKARPVLDDDQGSQKENSGLKVKPEKMAKGKEKAMPPRGPAVQEHSDQEDHDELESDADEGERASSPNGRKRVRVDEDGTGHTVKAELQDNQRMRVATLPRGEDGYIPGSIVRIQLKNFVTYDWVEFRPGPYLNMIVGPNGTGKSSIACAICLGLNWPPQVLGRASELNSFVKMGTNEGYIEIELKGPKGQRNLVIRRLLTASSRSSKFKLNGDKVTAREISNRVAQLNVQVGNLCSFLPQDKVAEFAQMNSYQLLRETQRAAGDQRLTEWHDTLITSGRELRSIQDVMNGQRDQLKVMQDRNAALERDVLRYKERKRIEHEIALLEILLPVQTYREMRQEWLTAKEVKSKLYEKVVKLKERNAPAHALKEKLEKQHIEYAKRREAKKGAAQTKVQKAIAKRKESERLEEEMESVTEKLSQLRSKERDRARRLKVLKTTIAACEAELAKPLQTEDAEVIKAEGASLRRAEGGLKARFEELRVRQVANAEASGKEQAVINASMQNLQSLDDVNVRKLQNLANWDKDCHDVVVWLRNNGDKFRMQVFEPPALSLNVPDRRFANAVEACFNSNQLRCFVTQCQEDMDTLNRVVNDTTEALGRPARINTWFMAEARQRLIQPPMSDEELKAFGFDGYAIDYVDCPDGLRWYLQTEIKLHRTAIGLNATRVRVDKAMDAAARIMPTGGGGGATFFAGHTMNQVKRSMYGQKASQNITREIHPARNFVGPSVDLEAKRRLDAAIQEARMRREHLEGEAKTLSEEEVTLRGEGDTLKQKMDGIKSRLKAVTDAETHRIQTQTKLETAKEELNKNLAEPAIDVQRVDMKKELYDLAMRRIQIAKEYAQLVRKTINDLREATTVGLQFLQVEANKNALIILCREKDAKCEAAMTKWNDASRAYAAAKERSKQALDISRKIIEEVDEDIRAEYNRLEEDRIRYDTELKKAQETGAPLPSTADVELRDAETLQVDLETQRHRLELHLQTNPRVLEQYEQRQAEIESLSLKVQEAEGKMAKYENAIRVAKNNWKPALERLVQSIGEKFSAAFDRIGCAGEIRIKEDEDYEKWAIDILVKFRDDEKLQVLTAQRQSGGERALTTILYLMSLTEEARAPFSLVDEINQGMDETAERAVHNSMVDVTCQPDSAQYFLITPKLLPGLNYHERMKILCVNNGEWLPEEKNIGNMMKMIDSYLTQAPKAVAA